MRLVKPSILGALLVIAASALVGPTAASATDTAVCNAHEGLACANEDLITETHSVAAAGTTVKLLSSLVDILCLSALVEATVLEYAPLGLDATSLVLTGCGTGSNHNNCTATVEELPSFTVLKTGLDEGIVTATSGSVQVECPNLGLDCEYDIEGTEFSASSQHLTASEAPITELGGKFFCPDEGTLDFLLESLESAYVLQSPLLSALCINHEEPCKAANASGNLSLPANEPPKVLAKFGKTTLVVECEKSTLKLAKGYLGFPLYLDKEGLTWENCAIVGGEKCEVESLLLGKLELEKVNLNLGRVTSVNTEVLFKCGKELNCKFGGKPVLIIEGAGHSAKAGNGRISAIDEPLSGAGTNCPDSATLDASYKSTTAFYVVH